MLSCLPLIKMQATTIHGGFFDISRKWKSKHFLRYLQLGANF